MGMRRARCGWMSSGPSPRSTHVARHERHRHISSAASERVARMSTSVHTGQLSVMQAPLFTRESSHDTTRRRYPPMNFVTNFSRSAEPRGWNIRPNIPPGTLGRGVAGRSSGKTEAAPIRAPARTPRAARFADARSENRTVVQVARPRGAGLRSRPRAGCSDRSVCFTGIPRSASIARSCSGLRPRVVR